MTRKPVESSNVASVGYDEAGRLLEVAFQNGGVYQYEGVPPVAYVELMHAESVGGYLARNIKPRYPVKKIKDAAAE